jgi:hypothetical protein
MEEEAKHTIEVLEKVIKAIKNEDALALKELSNMTIHTASAAQDTGSITIAVLVYTLSKIIERKHSLKIKNWNVFIRRINSFFALAIKSLKEENNEKYQKYMEMARKSMTSTSLNIKHYIQEVMRKASINKASRVYEHGISMGQTATILGITQWELSEYAGQSRIPDISYNITFDVAKRAKMALEFFK